MTSETELHQRERIVEKLAEHGVRIDAVKNDTERILNHLDRLNGRVHANEKGIARLQGIGSVLFVAVSVVLGFMAFL
tara:strand:- start:1692 stop:1922 length:231 start_codon:yes stop_codon:yes gene_type:complete